jgi:hypothetical protein
MMMTAGHCTSGTHQATSHAPLPTIHSDSGVKETDSRAVVEGREWSVSGDGPGSWYQLAANVNLRDFARLKLDSTSSDNGVGSNLPSQPNPFNMSLSWTSYALNKHEIADLIPVDLRVSQRIMVRCEASLCCDAGAGRERTISGCVLNMSSSGVLVEASRPMAVGSQVRIRANELLVGTAYVRYSTRRSWKFRIGLEFATPVRNRY